MVGNIVILPIPYHEFLILYPINCKCRTIKSLRLYCLHCVTQVALASLECVQPAVLVSDEQSASLLSFPVQPMFVKEIGPLPGPNAAPDCAVASANRNVHINYEIECRNEICNQCTMSGESQLPAYNGGVIIWPHVITDSAPGLTKTNFHTTRVRHWTNQSDICMLADSWEKKHSLVEKNIFPLILHRIPRCWRM